MTTQLSISACKTLQHAARRRGPADEKDYESDRILLLLVLLLLILFLFVILIVIILAFGPCRCPAWTPTSSAWCPVCAGAPTRSRTGDAFGNYWTVAVPAFYQKRGLTRKTVTDLIPWRIARDLSARIAVAAGLARLPDYRDELEELSRDRFGSRCEFCKATGLPEEQLRAFLLGHADLSLTGLSEGLERRVPGPPGRARMLRFP